MVAQNEKNVKLLWNVFIGVSAAPDGVELAARVHVAHGARPAQEARARAEAAAEESEAEGGVDPQAVPRDVQNPDAAVQGAQVAPAADDRQGRAEARHQKAQGRADAQTGFARRPVRAEHCRDAAEAVHQTRREPGSYFSLLALINFDVSGSHAPFLDCPSIGFKIKCNCGCFHREPEIHWAKDPWDADRTKLSTITKFLKMRDF